MPRHQFAIGFYHIRRPPWRGAVLRWRLGLGVVEQVVQDVVEHDVEALEARTVVDDLLLVLKAQAEGHAEVTQIPLTVDADDAATLVVEVRRGGQRSPPDRGSTTGRGWDWVRQGARAACLNPVLGGRSQRPRLP